jgi:ABC-type nitrate/sulfonate/bicarbonate transport system substrate-binding protein
VLSALPLAASAETKLVLQLHREAQFEFAGYYAALWQGFYQAAGLDVEIKPGTPPGASTIDPVREVTEGRAQFGTGTLQLLVRAAQGQSLLLLAPIFQQSGAAVYYRSDRDLTLSAALLTGRVGRLPASNVLDLELRTALYGEGIDPEKVKSVSMQQGEAIDGLTSRQVDAAGGSAWELPWLARERGVLLRAFNLSSYRTEFYGDSLFTLQRLGKADPVMVQRFREASIKG